MYWYRWKSGPWQDFLGAESSEWNVDLTHHINLMWSQSFHSISEISDIGIAVSQCNKAINCGQCYTLIHATKRLIIKYSTRGWSRLLREMISKTLTSFPLHSIISFWLTKTFPSYTWNRNCDLICARVHTSWGREIWRREEKKHSAEI